MKLTDIFFGCRHERTSFPRSSKSNCGRPEVEQNTETYVVCLDCGMEFGYDWRQMRRLGPRRKDQTTEGRLGRTVVLGKRKPQISNI